jgi:metallo-beta-lactamase class B
MTNGRPVLLAFGMAVALGASVIAQAPPAPRPDSDAIRQQLDALRKTAGTEWTETFDFFCAANPNRANRPDDPELEPTRVFDNLWVVGRTSTAVWIVSTSAGLVLIDAGYPDQLDSVLLKGMKTLGLDPARVTHVIVGHGHADHFGGAPYFQQRGARIAMGGPDWDAASPLTRDIAIADGQTLTVGDVTFTFAMIPGHTPGSIGVAFPVRDDQATRMAGLFGGSILIPGRIPDDGLRQYLQSLERWAAVTAKLNVDVEIQNHPMYDGLEAKLARLKRRASGEPHPFVVGRDAYQRFLSVMSGCIGVQQARRALK